MSDKASYEGSFASKLGELTMLSYFRSDIVVLLDDKTIYIPNFFLTVGKNTGYRFKV